MKITTLLVVSLLTLSLTGTAATFERSKTVKSVSLSKVLAAWKNASDGQEDAGWSAAKIAEKKDSEKWEHTVKQFLHTQGDAENVSATKKSLESLDSLKAVRELVSQHSMAEDLKKSKEEKELVAALDGLNGNKLVFVGQVSGDAFSYEHLTFIDVTRMEILSLYAGVSD